MEEPEYTIAPSGRYRYYQWILYLGVILVLAYLYLTYIIYQDEGWSSKAIINLLIAVIYAAVIYFNRTAGPPYDEISFSEEGITILGDKKSEIIEWSALYKLSITNNSLFLDFKDDRQKELNISYLKYNQLQEAKEKVRSFCEQQQLSFSSKY